MKSLVYVGGGVTKPWTFSAQRGPVCRAGGQLPDPGAAPVGREGHRAHQVPPPGLAASQRVERRPAHVAVEIRIRAWERPTVSHGRAPHAG